MTLSPGNFSSIQTGSESKILTVLVVIFLLAFFEGIYSILINLRAFLRTIYNLFDFTRPLGVLHQKKIVFWLAVNHRYHIWKCMRRAGFVSNGFQLSLACSLFIFGRI